MISSYQAGYVTGRWFTKVVKMYLGTKIVKSAYSKAVQISKSHKIDSKDPEVVTNNLFDCLQYID